MQIVWCLAACQQHFRESSNPRVNPTIPSFRSFIPAFSYLSHLSQLVPPSGPDRANQLSELRPPRHSSYRCPLPVPRLRQLSSMVAFEMPETLPHMIILCGWYALTTISEAGTRFPSCVLMLLSTLAALAYPHGFVRSRLFPSPPCAHCSCTSVPHSITPAFDNDMCFHYVCTHDPRCFKAYGAC